MRTKTVVSTSIRVAHLMVGRVTSHQMRFRDLLISSKNKHFISTLLLLYLLSIAVDVVDDDDDDDEEPENDLQTEVV